MDEIDRKIIDLLAGDARRPLAALGASVGLSASAVNERIRRLNANGAIRRFTIDVAPDAVELPILAFVWIALANSDVEAAFRSFAAGHPAIAECHHVTGAWSYLIKVHLASLSGLEDFLAELKAQHFIARSESCVTLSSVVAGGYMPKGQQ